MSDDMGWGSTAGNSVTIPAQEPEVEQNTSMPVGMPLFARIPTGKCAICYKLKRSPDILEMLNYILTVHVCLLDDEDDIVAQNAIDICRLEMKKRKTDPQIIAALTQESVIRHVSHLKNSRIMAARFYSNMSALFHNQLSVACDGAGEIPKDKISSLEKFSNLAFRWHLEAKEAELWARQQKNAITEDLGKVTTMDMDA